MKTLDAVMGEKEFMASVVELATVLGWRSYHTHDSRRSAPGSPIACSCATGASSSLN